MKKKISESMIAIVLLFLVGAILFDKNPFGSLIILFFGCFIIGSYTWDKLKRGITIRKTLRKRVLI